MGWLLTNMLSEMRDDLKGRTLSFTDIAKLVGENWQSLPSSEKEAFEAQAQKAKKKYNHDMAEYKKTPECKMYMQYLQDFRAKHLHQQGLSAPVSPSPFIPHAASRC